MGGAKRPHDLLLDTQITWCSGQAWEFFFLVLDLCQHLKMISKDDQKHLITLCDHFINSGNDVTLAHLLDALNTVIPDANSQDRKEWSNYMEVLNEVWVHVNKEGETLP